MKQSSAHENRMPTQDDDFEAAAEWHDRLDDELVSPVVRAEFDAWLAGGPGRREAYEAVDRMWTMMAAASVEPRVVDMRRRAMSELSRTRYLRRIVAAMCAAFIGVVIWLQWAWIFGSPGASQRIEGGSLHTALGERASVTLSDGSVVVLNTDSLVDIRYTSAERRVHLLKGQAWFRVAKNRTRPFIVEAGNQRVTALGTAFDVRIDEQRNTVQVSLAEGRVSVAPVQLPLLAWFTDELSAAELAPGEKLLAPRDAPVTKGTVDVDRIGSWRDGEVVFDDETLEAAVAEINRYSSRKIELADPTLGAFRVSGVFKTGNNSSFIETVTGHYPIDVRHGADGRITLKARDQAPQPEFLDNKYH